MESSLGALTSTGFSEGIFRNKNPSSVLSKLLLSPFALSIETDVKVLLCYTTVLRFAYYLKIDTVMCLCVQYISKIFVHKIFLLLSHSKITSTLCPTELWKRQRALLGLCECAINMPWFCLWSKAWNKPIRPHHFDLSYQWRWWMNITSLNWHYITSSLTSLIRQSVGACGWIGLL